MIRLLFFYRVYVFGHFLKVEILCTRNKKKGFKGLLSKQLYEHFSAYSKPTVIILEAFSLAHFE